MDIFQWSGIHSWIGNSKIARGMAIRAKGDTYLGNCGCVVDSLRAEGS